MNTEIKVADYLNKVQGDEIAYLLSLYSKDPMGGGHPLDDYVIKNIAVELSKRSEAFSVIGYVDATPAGLVNCFEGFSTFACKPLVNIHDMIVLEQFRGKGLSHKMLNKVEEIAIDRGCCKLTLEVLSGNTVAQSSYQKFGFAAYELDPVVGTAQFWQKPLKR